MGKTWADTGRLDNGPRAIGVTTLSEGLQGANYGVTPEFTGGLLDVLEREGIGCIAFSPLAQGVLTGKYLNGIPEGSRATQHGSLTSDQLSEETLGHVRALAGVAGRRGQSLAQMAISWVLRDQRVTSALIGASSVTQLEENLAAAQKTGFSDEELAEIDRHAVDAGINIWAASSAH